LSLLTHYLKAVLPTAPEEETIDSIYRVTLIHRLVGNYLFLCIVEDKYFVKMYLTTMTIPWYQLHHSKTLICGHLCNRAT